MNYFLLLIYLIKARGSESMYIDNFNSLSAREDGKNAYKRVKNEEKIFCCFKQIS